MRVHNGPDGKPLGAIGTVQPAVPDTHPVAKLRAAAEAREVTKQYSGELPPIIMGDLDGALKLMVDYIVDTAVSPQPFLALGGALAAIGALAGRRYASLTDVRTNVFAVGLANSGSGKDQARKCIKRLYEAAAVTKYLGGEDVSSGQAVLSSIEIHPARLFLLDEFGHMLSGLTSRNAASHKQNILSTLTKLNTSASEVVFGTEYAHQKGEKARQRVDLHQPHVCVYGTTVASVLWQAVGTGAIGDGSLARYLLFQSPENNPDYNKRPASKDAMPDALIDLLARIAAGPPDHDYGGNIAGAMQAACEAVPYVVQEDAAATAALDALLDEQLAWKRRLEKARETGEAFVARWRERTACCAMIRAIGRCPEAPVITLRDVVWAKSLTLHCLKTAMRETDAHVADSVSEAHAKRLLDIVRKAGENGITARDLAQRTRFVGNKRDRKALMDDLVETGEIHPRKQGSGRSETIIYTAAIPTDQVH